MNKVSVIGGGNVGGTLAQRLQESGLCEVVLVDIVKGIAEGKSKDMADARPILGCNSSIKGTTDFKEIAGSDIVVVTAGLPRQPGMSREDLLKKNAGIIKEVIAEVTKYASNAILLMVTNPLDILTYVALKQSKFSEKKVIGMGGVLDSARFANLIAEELKINSADVQAMVIGAHGETMIPLAGYTTVFGKKVTELLSREKLDSVIKNTITRGAEIVGLLGKGSAYYAPSAAAFVMVKAILKDEKKVVPACVYLNSEYGLKDVCIGVPVRLGKAGVEEIIELKLSDEEKEKLVSSAQALKTSVSSLL